MKFLVAATAALSVAAPGHRHRSHCPQLFTIPMGQRAARAVYRGTRKVTLANLRLLGYIERCQWVPSSQRYVRWYDRHLGALHRQRVLAAQMPPLQYATASWYELAIPGPTASGLNYWNGVAHKTLPFGTHVLICFGGRCVDTIVDDRGPYVAGREFDLNQNVAAALGFSGVQTVGYAIGR